MLVCVPHYTTYHTSVVATGKVGSAPGELCHLFGVAIHEETHQTHQNTAPYAHFTGLL